MKSVGETLENVCRRTFNSHPLQSVHLQCKSYCMQKTSSLVNTNVPTRVQSTRKFNSIRSRQTNGHDASLNYVLAFFFEKNGDWWATPSSGHTWRSWTERGEAIVGPPQSFFLRWLSFKDCLIPPPRQTKNTFCFWTTKGITFLHMGMVFECL